MSGYPGGGAGATRDFSAVILTLSWSSRYSPYAVLVSAYPGGESWVSVVYGVGDTRTDPAASDSEGAGLWPDTVDRLETESRGELG